MGKEFGWAYVVGSQASGPKGSVQLAGVETGLDHDPNLLWSDEANALLVSGNIVAHNFEIQNQTKTVFHFEVSGSSVFGDTPDDLHQFTGSLDISGNVSASAYYGYGGYLEGIAINEYTNFGDNRLITSVGEKSVHAEDGLTFDGDLLNVSGNISSFEISSSLALFNSANIGDVQVDSFTDSVITIQTGTIAGLDHLEVNTLAGTLITPAQPNITQVGTLTNLNVENDATINSTLWVKSAENRVGVNTSVPSTSFEVLSITPQLRLTSQNYVFGVQDAQHTDLFTDTSGRFSISPTSGFVGINKADPTVALDVNGDAYISGNLVVSGTLTARSTDFAVSADTLTFGDEASDQVIINAQTIQTPNNLEINEAIYVSGSTVGVGDYSTGSKFEVSNTSDQLKITNGTNSLSVNVQNGSTTLSSSVGNIDITSKTNVLNAIHVGSSGDIVLDNAGQLSASVSVSSTSGYFTNLTSSVITNGDTTINSGSVDTPTLNATTINGTIATTSQPNITQVGTLNSLSVSGDATLGSNVIHVDSTANRVGISKGTPQKKVEIKDTDTQLRLTHSDFVFGVSQYTYADLQATATGDLSLLPSSGKVIAPALQLTNVQQGTANSYLSVDGNGNVILAPSTQSTIEVRNRTLVTGSYSVQNSDYFVALSASQNLTVTLPDASTMFNGQIMVVKDEAINADVYDLHVTCQAGQTIDGTQQIKLVSAGSAINFYTDGHNRFFIF